MQTRKLHLTTDYWEERANRVLSRFNYGRPCEIDIYDICFKYGIQLRPLDEEDNVKLEAYSIAHPKARTGVIYLKESLSEVKKSSSSLKNFAIYMHIAGHN